LRTPALPLVAVASIVALSACGDGPRAALPGGAEGPGRVLATVNGVPITALDVEHRLRKAAGSSMGGHEVTGGAGNNALSALVRDELLLQEAERLRLDADPEYRLKLAALEAQLRAFQRKELVALYRRHLQRRASVTDAEAQAWFDANASTLRTRFHVQQILYKGDPASIAQAKQDLDAGVPFETVAARRFPVVPKGKTPWDLGELAWGQLPSAWRGVVDRLEPGQVSGIIRGEGDRAWLVRLVARTVDPGITFDTEKDRIIERLHQERSEALYAGALEELRAKADISWTR